MWTFRTFLHKLLKLNNLSTFHVEQLIDVPRGTNYRRSTWNKLSAFHVEHHNTRHLEHFPGVLILSPNRRFSPVFSLFGDSANRRFSPVFSLFGGSAVRVGRRTAESRVAPNNFPDPITTCRRNVLPPNNFPDPITTCRRNVLPPNNFPDPITTCRRNDGKTFCR